MEKIQGKMSWRLEVARGTGKSWLVLGVAGVEKKELETCWQKQQGPWRWCSDPRASPLALALAFALAGSPWRWAQVRQLYLPCDWLTLLGQQWGHPCVPCALPC